MADKKRRGPDKGSQGDEAGPSIFDLFEPPPSSESSSFARIPIIRDDDSLDLTDTEYVEAQAAAEAEAAGLAHWTEPATGQVPAAFAAGQAGKDGLVKAPSWRGEEGDWIGPDLSDVFADTASITHDRLIENDEDDDLSIDPRPSLRPSAPTRRPSNGRTSPERPRMPDPTASGSSTNGPTASGPTTNGPTTNGLPTPAGRADESRAPAIGERPDRLGRRTTRQSATPPPPAPVNRDGRAPSHVRRHELEGPTVASPGAAMPPPASANGGDAARASVGSRPAPAPRTGDAAGRATAAAPPPVTSRPVSPGPATAPSGASSSPPPAQEAGPERRPAERPVPRAPTVRPSTSGDVDSRSAERSVPRVGTVRPSPSGDVERPFASPASGHSVHNPSDPIATGYPPPSTPASARAAHPAPSVGPSAAPLTSRSASPVSPSPAGRSATGPSHAPDPTPAGRSASGPSHAPGPTPTGPISGAPIPSAPRAGSDRAPLIDTRPGVAAAPSAPGRLLGAHDEPSPPPAPRPRPEHNDAIEAARRAAGAHDAQRPPTDDADTGAARPGWFDADGNPERRPRIEGGGQSHPGLLQDGDDPDPYEPEESDEYDSALDDALGYRTGGRNLGQSVVVGVALAAIVFTALAVGPLPTIILVGLVTLLAVLELFNAMRVAGLRPATLLGLVGAVALPTATYVRGDAGYPLVIGLAVVFGMLWYLTGADTERPVLNLGLTLTGIGWIGGLAGFAALMLRADGGTGLLLAAVIITASSDTLAYFGGRAYGTKSFHSASPNKTWEGTITGFFGALLAGLAIGVSDLISVFDGQFTAVMVIAAVVGVLAPIGDLAESLVKRDLGIKDMGTILPGHGGVLDRIDGLIFALPGAYYVAVVYGLI